MTILAALIAAAVELHADPAHTTATFAVKHLVVTTVRGQFNKVESTLMWDKQDPTKSTVQVHIDAASVDTHVEKRDNDLRSPNFFDVAKCPDISFKSTKVEKAAAPDTYKVTGDLTMHCQTKPLTLDVAFNPNGTKSPWGTTVWAGSATAHIKRSDWGLTWNKTLESGGVVVSDDVDLEVDGEFGEPPKK
jgi:polyisoprenoid-binding protein YceI